VHLEGLAKVLEKGSYAGKTGINARRSKARSCGALDWARLSRILPGGHPPWGVDVAVGILVVVSKNSALAIYESFHQTERLVSARYIH